MEITQTQRSQVTDPLGAHSGWLGDLMIRYGVSVPGWGCGTVGGVYA